MQISKRVQALTTSPIRGLVPYADAAKARGIKVYHLNIGQPDIETPPQFVEALRKYDHKVVAYGNSQGEKVLLQAISNYYKSWDMYYGTDNIFITNGGSEALSSVVSIRELEQVEAEMRAHRLGMPIAPLPPFLGELAQAVIGPDHAAAAA